MMKLEEIKQKFTAKEIDKQEFISRMYENHLVLKDYVDFLPNSGISKIEINDEGLVFTSRATAYHPGGMRFISDIQDKRVTALEAFNFGRYEDEDSEMIYKLISTSDTVFDIGANIGWYTTHIAKILNTGKLFSFEPIPDTFLNLAENVKLNGLTNTHLNNWALSDSEGELTFYYSPKQTGASSSQNITENANAVLVKCKTQTLDKFCADENIRQVDFIKCDVEGAELFVFKGAVETLKNRQPVVFTEMLRKWAHKFNYHPNDIIQLFASLGYKCFTNSGGKLKALELVDETTSDTNFFFLHAVKHADKIKSNQ